MKITSDCHAHLIMDGHNYRKAVDLHKENVCKDAVRTHLQAYHDCGITFLRDGGDARGVSQYARSIAAEYGIDYRSPIYAIHQRKHYGGIVGKGFDTMEEYRVLVDGVRALGGDFIKIMVSGIMEYSACGLLSEPGQDPSVIREMVHIAKEEGFAVMVHGNGAEPVLAAVEAGADSIEHGNYINHDCLHAMSETGCVWVPTIVTTHNLIGCGRYEDKVLCEIYECECENLRAGYKAGVPLAIGSDAGAYLVPHGKAAEQEYACFLEALCEEPQALLDEGLLNGENRIKMLFRYSP